MHPWKHFLFVAFLGLSTTWSQVQIGGTTVPKDKFIVFFFLGQSNMAGRAKSGGLADVYTQTDSRLWSFNIKDRYHGGDHHKWIPAKAILHKDRYASGGYGPGMPFLKRMLEQYPGYYFGIVQNAETQTTLKDYLNDGAPHGDKLYSQLKSAISELKGKVTFGGVVTMLGLIERASSDDVNNYASNMKKLGDKLRTEMGSQDVPFLVTQYEMGSSAGFDPSEGMVPKLIDQINSVPSKLSRSAVVPTDFSKDRNKYMQDDHHFNRAGHVEWARIAVDIVKNKGWLQAGSSDKEPPTAPGALKAGAVTVSSIELSWNASTDNEGVKDYTVSAGGDALGTTVATNWTVKGLEACRTYSFTVKASDIAGNVSAASTALEAKTSCAGDTEKPTAPSKLAIQAATLVSLTLSWQASTDNVSVAKYTVFVNGKESGSTAKTNLTVEGLDADTEYELTVRAEDPSGNQSALSVALKGKTAGEVSLDLLPLKINVGGDATNGYVADQPWKDGGVFGHTGSPMLAKVSDQVSGTDVDGVYQSVMFQNFGYKIQLNPGDYELELLFADFWRDQGGQRTFRGFVNGKEISDQPIDVAGSAGKATAYSVRVPVRTSNGLVEISFTSIKGDPILSGIVLKLPAPYVITTPKPGNSFAVGETVTFTWEADTSLVADATLHLSADGGENWLLVNTDGSLTTTNPKWKSYPWKIPEKLEGVDLAGKELMVRIKDYEDNYFIVMDGTFKINAEGASIKDRFQSLPAMLSVSWSDGRLSLNAFDSEFTLVKIHTFDGREIHRATFSGAYEVMLPEMANGFLWLEIGSGGKSHTALIRPGS